MVLLCVIYGVFMALLSVISVITVGDVSATSDIWSFTTEGNYIGYLTLTTQAKVDAFNFIEVK
jgi:hypothetical protein